MDKVGEMEKSELKGNIAKLKDSLRTGSWNDEQKRAIRSKMGDLYAKMGAGFRARWNYSQAGDYAGLAGFYEARGDLKNAERAWLLASGHGNVDDAKDLAQRIGYAQRALETAKKLGDNRLVHDAELAYNVLTDIQATRKYQKRKKTAGEKREEEEEDNEEEEGRRRYGNESIDMGNALEKLTDVFGLIAVFSAMLAVLFFATNFTGNVIGNSTQSYSNVVGAIFFILAIVATIFVVRKKTR